MIAQKVTKFQYLISESQKVDNFICIQNSNFCASPSSLWFKWYILLVWIIFQQFILCFLLELSFSRCICSCLHCILVHIHNTPELENFWYCNHEKAKRVSILDQRKLSYKKVCRHFIWKYPKSQQLLLTNWTTNISFNIDWND